MIDAKTGKVMASAPICKGTDATSYDPGTKLAFASLVPESFHVMVFGMK